MNPTQAHDQELIRRATPEGMRQTIAELREEVAQLKEERDNSDAEYTGLNEQLQTIADEATGPHPLLDAAVLCDEIERALTAGRIDREELRAEVARLKAEKDTLAEVSRAIIDRLERENKDLLRDALTLERVKSVLATGGE